MNPSNIVLCELKGSVNSNPQILKSYPNKTNDKKSKELVLKFLPFESKKGDLIINKYQKNTILSYIFTIEHEERRNDLLSISITLTKEQNKETFKQVLKVLIEKMKNYNVLSEEILVSQLSNIYEGIYEEKDINIKGIELNLSNIIFEARSKYEEQKPNVRGSFF